MACSTLSSAATSSAISDRSINKLKIIHLLNTVGQYTLRIVYRYYKRFPNTQTIKDHLINDLGINEVTFRGKFDRTMVDVIINTAASGESYDISFLIACLKVLSSYYDHNDHKWSNKHELEAKCLQLANMRNAAFHSITGLSYIEMNTQMENINSLVNDILSSLKGRFPSASTDISNVMKEMDAKINDIRAHPLGKIEIKTYIAFKYLRDAIPSYKLICIGYGEMKMLDFLSRRSHLHDIKLLFTEVLVKQSYRYHTNKSIKCTDMITMASRDSILLISSEAGGGKTTTFRYVMHTASYDYIFPMTFRNQSICSVADLIKDLIPDIRVNMSNDDILKCLADPTFSILFYCDGYDERNKNSHKLYFEIRNLKEKYSHIKLIVTSRPESVKQLCYEKGGKLYIDHLQIMGIHEADREEFLMKYHEELKKAKISTESTGDLILFYKSCSSHHKDLYRLPINLVILAMIWGQDKEKVKTVKSAAGLYTAILEILDKKLVNRIIQHHASLNITHTDFDELREQIDQFKEILYCESLSSLRNNRMYSNQMGVKNLRKVCKDINLPFPELKGALLLTKLEWITDIEESLELPHKGMMDFFAAKYIEFKLIQGGQSIKEILLEFYGNDESQLELKKYQNVLQLLGGNLALSDASLVGKHGEEIINLLTETDISNNSQWFAVHCDLNVNSTAASTFGKLIAAQLNLEHFVIKDSDVEVVTNLLQYVDIDTVELEISDTAVFNQLPALVDVLVRKHCVIRISSINDEMLELWNSVLSSRDDIQIEQVQLDISGTTVFSHLPFLINLLRTKQTNIIISTIREGQIHLWTSIITPNDKLQINKVVIDHKCNNLPLESYNNAINEYKLTHHWRELEPAPQISEWAIKDLSTAVASIDEIPVTVEYLKLGLLVDPQTGAARDPGIALIAQKCTELEYLGLHVKFGTVVDHLPHLPKLKGGNYRSLYLSQLVGESSLQWAVNTAKTLQPSSRRGYYDLVLPRCQLDVSELCGLCVRLPGDGVNMDAMRIISPHSEDEKKQLQATIAGKWSLYWFQDEAEGRFGW